MTRFVVILTMSRLKVLSIASIQHHYCSTILERPTGPGSVYLSLNLGRRWMLDGVRPKVCWPMRSLFCARNHGIDRLIAGFN